MSPRQHPHRDVPYPTSAQLADPHLLARLDDHDRRLERIEGKVDQALVLLAHDEGAEEARGRTGERRWQAVVGFGAAVVGALAALITGSAT